MTESPDIPGFVDLQVNGYAGVDFSSDNLTAEGIDRAVTELTRRGTAGFLATVITSPPERYRRNLPLLVEAVARHEALLGIHLEGPFLCPEPGPAGAHKPKWIRQPDGELLDELLDLGAGTVRLLTLAANPPGSDALTRQARKRGVSVSLGHHLADLDDLARHAKVGAAALTHLGNGVGDEIHRHNNPILAGLACDDLTAMIITDGHHIPEHFIRIVLRVKSAARVIVVSDSAPVGGLPPGRYHTLGNDAVLEPDGRLHNPTERHLVGSASCMLQCMNYLAGLGLLDCDDLIRVGCTNPLKLIGMEWVELPRVGTLTYESEQVDRMPAFHFNPQG